MTDVSQYLDTITQGDCLEALRQLPDKSVNVIFTDPPYYRVMLESHEGDKVEWDNQWDSPGAFLVWINEIMAECSRVLADNGTIFVCMDKVMAGPVQVEMSDYFHIINNVTWAKTNTRARVFYTSARCFPQASEAILIGEQKNGSGLPLTGLQAIHSDKGCFTSIKEYMREGRRRAMEDMGMKTQKEFNEWINKLTGTSSVASRHYFADSQFTVPTAEHYAKMHATGYWPRPYESARAEYDGLREEYEGLRMEYEDQRKEYEALRRPWKPIPVGDVWTSCITSSTDPDIIHPTQKPVWLVDRCLQASARPGDIVLDPFMGSGTTAVASVRRKCHFIGFEQDPEYVRKASDRVARELKEVRARRTLDDFMGATE